MGKEEDVGWFLKKAPEEGSSFSLHHLLKSRKTEQKWKKRAWIHATKQYILGGTAKESDLLREEPQTEAKDSQKEGAMKAEIAQAKAARKKLKDNHAVIHGIVLFWNVCQKVKDDSSLVTQREYTNLHVRMQKTMMPTFDLTEAIQLAREDWKADGGATLKGGGMDYPHFFNSLFEVADLWLDDIDGVLYAKFLHKLYLNMVDHPKKRWKHLTKVQVDSSMEIMENEMSKGFHLGGPVFAPREESSGDASLLEAYIVKINEDKTFKVLFLDGQEADDLPYDELYRGCFWMEKEKVECIQKMPFGYGMFEVVNILSVEPPTKDCPDPTCTVLYHTGRTEKHVIVSRLRPLQTLFMAEEEVEVYHVDRHMWVPGTIIGMDNRGRFSVNVKLTSRPIRENGVPVKRVRKKDIIVDAVQYYNDMGKVKKMPGISIACQHGDHGAVETLLCLGTDPNEEDNNKSTPLMHAAYNNFVGVADLLLQSGADPNKKNLRRCTALHFAYERGHLDLCVELLSQGALQIKNLDGRKPFQLDPELHKQVKQMLPPDFQAGIKNVDRKPRKIYDDVKSGKKKRMFKRPSKLPQKQQLRTLVRRPGKGDGWGGKERPKTRRDQHSSIFGPTTGELGKSHEVYNTETGQKEVVMEPREPPLGSSNQREDDVTVHELVCDHEEVELKARLLFSKYDREKNGGLNRDEFQKVIKKLFPKNKRIQKQWRTYFEGYSSDGDSKIDFNEFVDFFNHAKGMTGYKEVR